MYTLYNEPCFRFEDVGAVFVNKMLF